MSSTAYGKTFTINATAEAAIATDIFVKIGVADRQFIPSTAGAKIIGISTDVIAIDTTGPVAYTGEYKLKIGGTVTRGDYLKSDSSGFGITVTTNLDEYGAVALESGVSGDTISVLVQNGIFSV